MVPDATPTTGLFRDARCGQIDLRYRVTRDTFDIARFLEFFGMNEQAGDKYRAAICRTLTPDVLDYHIHFVFELESETLTLYVSFHVGAIGPGENEREPHAEGFMPWLGSFFVNKTANADLHAEFRYPSEERQSRFLIPIKLTFSEDLETEIRGVTMSFPSAPDGFREARVEQRAKRLIVEVSGSVQTRLDEFDLRSEVGLLSCFALRLTEERK